MWAGSGYCCPMRHPVTTVRFGQIDSETHTTGRRERLRSGGDGGESNSPSRTLRRNPLRACPMLCRQPVGRPSAGFRPVQSRASRSSLIPDYATLIRAAVPLNDASTTRRTEVASTLTLLPKQRGRESTGGCQVLRFAALMTGPEQHPRLASSDNQALSKPHIPTGPNVRSTFRAILADVERLAKSGSRPDTICPCD
jgi:hypothetical protein